jgi:alpha-N-arabinofuranosidase
MKNQLGKFAGLAALCLLPLAGLHAAEWHVAVTGKDTQRGTKDDPLQTIQHAADLAQPADVITVHAGVYRERINPPRGGESDAKRIVYQAAPGEKVEIKGSEVVTNWEKVQDDTWKVILPNAIFGKFNPYSDLIHGDWYNKSLTNHTGAVYLNGKWLREAKRLEDVLKPADDNMLWFAQVDDTNTTIWAQFRGVSPNENAVEINVRQSVFYPDRPGRNFITVRGFGLMHAATPWAPPTAEQIGLIGTHWSKGWIIENNGIHHSTCVGVTLGKYGDAWDNKGESNEGYFRTIKLARENGWTKDNIGHHIVRYNTISHCEQAGIVGSLGAVFSEVSGNTIHDINQRGLLDGAETAGIKFHAAIDVTISGNQIHHACRAIWMDWMAQGLRVTRNLFHDNGQDLFFEVDHGPILVDNNLCLSRSQRLLSNSQGVAFVHNLMVQGMSVSDQADNQTPLHKPHSTEFAKSAGHPSGDHRYYNNLIEEGDLTEYDTTRLPVWMSGNVFLKGAKPSKQEAEPFLKPDFDPALNLLEMADGLYLEITADKAWATERTRKLVTTELLGKAVIPDQTFENPDGTPLRIDTDYFGKKRNEMNPFPGPFENPAGGKLTLKVWEIKKISQ